MGDSLWVRKHGEVSEKCRQNQVAYGQFDLDVEPADGLGARRICNRKVAQPTCAGI